MDLQENHPLNIPKENFMGEITSSEASSDAHFVAVNPLIFIEHGKASSKVLEGNLAANRRVTEG